jgi:hypothetical protein
MHGDDKKVYKILIWNTYVNGRNYFREIGVVARLRLKLVVEKVVRVFELNSAGLKWSPVVVAVNAEMNFWV